MRRDDPLLHPLPSRPQFRAGFRLQPIVLLGLCIALLPFSQTVRATPPSTASPAASPTHTIVLVRHAEKVDESPTATLSPLGKARAQRLAELLAMADVRRIYVTEFQRTAQTAQPLAERLHLVPIVLPAQAREPLLAALRSASSDGVTLVVGHSNTLPAILAGLGIASVPSIEASDYGNVFVVVLNPPPQPSRPAAPPTPPHPASPTLIRLRY